MGKGSKLIAKTCVYCGHQATTDDHVIARCLLEKPFPPNLPTVPSCRPCNEAFGLDEQYFIAVMAKTGFVPSLVEKVEQYGVVDRTLSRNEALDSYFARVTVVGEDGRVSIMPNEVRIANVARKVAFGLYLHRYRPRYSPKIDEFFAIKPKHDREPDNFIVTMAHTERFRPRRWTHFQTLRVAGKKTQVFDYMFVRNWVYTDFGRLFCIMRFHETIWAAVRCPHPSPVKVNRRNLARGTAQGTLFDWAGMERQLPTVE